MDNYFDMKSLELSKKLRTRQLSEAENLRLKWTKRLSNIPPVTRVVWAWYTQIPVMSYTQGVRIIRTITLLRACEAGRIRFFRIGTRVLYCEEQLTEFLTACERNARTYENDVPPEA